MESVQTTAVAHLFQTMLQKDLSSGDAGTISPTQRHHTGHWRIIAIWWPAEDILDTANGDKSEYEDPRNIMDWSPQ
jgi:hypothetical protein